MGGKRIRIPASELEMSLNLDLKKWKYPRKVFYKAIDLYRDVLAIIPYTPVDDDDSDEPDSVEVLDAQDLYVKALCDVINKENSLLKHVLKQSDVAIDTKWQDYLRSAAWLVLQGYVRACNRGEWPQ